MKIAVAMLLACLLLASPQAAWANRDEEASPQAIRKQIEQLRIVYTDDHPDIQILKRRLDRAEKAQEKKRQEKAARQQSGQSGAAQAPASPKGQP